MGRSPDVVVIGAGVVGAACAYHLAGAGVRVRLLDRSYVASGSSGACEGNVLAWDKELERELPLALRSADLWQRLAAELPDDFEYDRKGSIVGRATSGYYGHVLRKSLAIGYVNPAFATVGTELEIEILGERKHATVLVDSPFDPQNQELRA